MSYAPLDASVEMEAGQLPAASSSTKPKAAGGWQRAAASSRRSPGMGKVSAAKGFQLVVKAQVAAKHERETAKQMQDRDEAMQREKMQEAANEAPTWFEHPCFAHLERPFVRRPIIALLALAPFISALGPYLRVTRREYCQLAPPSVAHTPAPRRALRPTAHGLRLTKLRAPQTAPLSTRRWTHWLPSGASRSRRCGVSCSSASATSCVVRASTPLS